MRIMLWILVPFLLIPGANFALRFLPLHMPQFWAELSVFVAVAVLFLVWLKALGWLANAE